MARTYELAFKIGASMAGNFAKTMSSASGALGELNNRLGAMGKQQAAIQSLVNLRTQVANTSREYIQAKQRVAELGRTLSNTTNPSKALRNEFSQAQQTVSRVKDKLNAQRTELRSLNEQMGATKKGTAELVREQNRLAESAQKAAKLQTSLQQNIAAKQANVAKRGELRGQLFDAVALAATMGAPVKLAADWEQNLAELNKVAGKTPEEINKISKAAQAMAVSTGVAREGIIGAYIAAAQAGFDEKEWDKYAEVSAKMGVAFDTTGEQAGEMLKAWRSSMGLSMSQAEELAAAANHIANNMNATALDVGEVLQRQGAVLKSAGLSDTQGAALAAAMLSGGAAAEVAATASKNFVLALTKGGNATKAEKAALQSLGFHDPARLAKAMQKGPEQAIMLVLERISKVDSDKQTALISQLFGKETVGAVAPLVANMKNLAGAFDLVRDKSQYITSLEDEFAAMGSTTQNQARKATEGLKAMGTAVGSVLLPPINQFLATAAPLALKLAQLAQDFPMVTTVIVGTTAALVGIKIAAIAGGYAFTFVKGAILSVQSMLLIGRTAWALYTGAMVASTATSRTAIIVSKLMTAAQWLFNAALSANPIGLVIVAIGALVAAGVWLYKNWDTVVEFFSAAWEKIKGFFASFQPLDWVREKIEGMLAWLNNFSLYESGVKMLTTLSDGIKSAAGKAVDQVKDALAKVRDYLPFSDAKIGPLSELTASGQAIMTTLAQGMERADIAQVTAPLGSIGAALPGAGSGSLDAMASRIGGGGAGGGITISVEQNISVGGGSGADVYQQAKSGAQAGASDMLSQLRTALEQERRLSYA